MTFTDFDRVWLLTWTTYGQWLPGDKRGFVSATFERDNSHQWQKQNNIVGSPCDKNHQQLQKLAEKNMLGPKIELVQEHATVLKNQFDETAVFLHWGIIVGAIMVNHVHLLLGVLGDPEPDRLVDRMKSYGSRALNKQFGRPESGTWWTRGASTRIVHAESYENRVNYVLFRQNNPLIVWDNRLASGGVSPP